MEPADLSVAGYGVVGAGQAAGHLSSWTSLDDAVLRALAAEDGSELGAHELEGHLPVVSDLA